MSFAGDQLRGRRQHPSALRRPDVDASTPARARVAAAKGASAPCPTTQTSRMALPSHDSAHLGSSARPAAIRRAWRRSGKHSIPDMSNIYRNPSFYR